MKNTKKQQGETHGEQDGGCGTKGCRGSRCNGGASTSVNTNNTAEESTDVKTLATATLARELKDNATEIIDLLDTLMSGDRDTSLLLIESYSNNITDIIEEYKQKYISHQG